MKKILIVNNYEQFGYHIDTFKYAEHLNNKLAFTFFSWYYGLEKRSIKNVKVEYRKYKPLFFSKLFTVFKFLFNARKDHDLFFLRYFPLVSAVLLFLPNESTILDIRTTHTSKNILRREIYNFLLKLEAKLFKRITVISEGVAKKLSLSHKAYSVLPLGADIISNTKKEFNEMRLLYVGTFNNRRIYATVEGFAKFYHEYKNVINMSYTIIGDGKAKEKDKILRSIEQNNLTNIVKYEGFVNHDKLKKYFDSCNIGVSYVPINEIFNYQPPTKTYEYLLSGMIILATDTYENRIIVDSTNGQLIKDSVSEFYLGLQQIYNNLGSFSSVSIRSNTSEFLWPNIIDKHLIPILKRMK